MTSTTLKLLALVCMLLDHTADYIPGAPVWLHWIGRIAAPIFFFCMAWGFHHTHDRKLYLRRMYFFGVGMAMLDFACNNLYPQPYCFMTNNIFITLFLTGVICWILDLWNTDRKRSVKYLLFFALWQLISMALCVVARNLLPGYGVYDFVGAITGNLFFSEGGLLFVPLGSMLYLCRNKRKLQAVLYASVSVCLFLAIAAGGLNAEHLLVENDQWMMLFALPFFLLYNGKRGTGLKYFFYIFYPVHILILFFAGNLMLA
ncbi:MAG: TraX family protein [Oscillospiraceae bacterium]|nr:TraX family protein [Oscillospiraceae bacterium]